MNTDSDAADSSDVPVSEKSGAAVKAALLMVIEVDGAMGAKADAMGRAATTMRLSLFISIFFCNVVEKVVCKLMISLKDFQLFQQQ